jgi:hypothetical protein
MFLTHEQLLDKKNSGIDFLLYPSDGLKKLYQI